MNLNEKKWVIVTGASQGIGKRIAMRLLEENYCVVVSARNEEELIKEFGARENCIVRAFDFSKLDDIPSYISDIYQSVGSIHGLVHCAGIQNTLPLHMIKPTTLEKIFKVNTYSGILLVSSLSKKNICKEGASLVLISSLAAHEGAFGNATYAASKAAQEGFVHSSAPELANKGIRINAIAPGMVMTPMVENYFSHLTEDQRIEIANGYPLGIGEPDDIAALAEFLVGEKSKWMTGQVIIADGGHLMRKY